MVFLMAGVGGTFGLDFKNCVLDCKPEKKKEESVK